MNNYDTEPEIAAGVFRNALQQLHSDLDGLEGDVRRSSTPVRTVKSSPAPSQQVRRAWSRLERKVQDRMYEILLEEGPVSVAGQHPTAPFNDVAMDRLVAKILEKRPPSTSV
eukprot:Sspe_Gene.12495::Locus_4256_Transcript_1_1_Confidence_1.000_Length_3369::g.12495::m.12495